MYAVQCLFLSSGLLVTGSQDGVLRLFDQEGQLMTQKEGAHDDIIRKIKEYVYAETSNSTGHYEHSNIFFWGFVNLKKVQSVRIL